MKVASITEQVLTLVNKRLGLYRHFEDAVNKYKQSRDIGTLNSGRKTLETEHRGLSSEIASLQSKLKAEGSDLAEKVGSQLFNGLLGLSNGLVEGGFNGTMVTFITSHTKVQ